MNITKFQITIPGDLRERIKNYLAGLDEAIRRSPENRATIESEISTLEAEARRQSEKIGQLQRDAANSEKAAGKLSTAETRLRQVNARLAELRDTLANFKPVTLLGAAQIIEDLTRHYVACLPDAFADYVEPFCPTRVKALAVVKFTEAYRVLHGLRTWAYQLDSALATPESVARLRAVLARASRGQPHLGADVPGLAAEAAPAAPESAAADSTADAKEGQPA